MKKFLFRLEALLRVRTIHEALMQKELSLVQQKLSELNLEKELISKQITELLDSIRDKRDRKELFLCDAYYNLLGHLQESLVHLNGQIDNQAKMEEEKKEDLRLLVNKRKVLEKIEKKQYTEWLRSSHTKEELLNDSIQKTSSERARPF